MPNLSAADRQKRLEAIAEHASSVDTWALAGEALSITPNSLKRWWYNQQGGDDPIIGVINERLQACETSTKRANYIPETPKERKELHDARFWRNKFNRVTRELAAAEHVAERLSGVRDVPLQIPEYLPNHSTARGKSVIGCLLSDIHMGEVIASEEILGVNKFNSEICAQRLKRYFEAVVVIGKRWAEDTDCDGVVCAFAGDLISGDIHEELRITNDLTSHEQVQYMTECAIAGIELLRKEYGSVHVIFVPGNHGRNTPKSTAKLYSRLSYDMAIGAMVERHFRNVREVTFQMSAAKDQITPIYGRKLFTTHGDKIGTKGGMGFAGPVLPIVRGSKKIEAQQAGIGRNVDLIQFGHYHTTSNPGLVLSNGSVPGYSEYADDLRAGIEPPQQWCYLLHSKWWLRERLPIRLEDPKNLAEYPSEVPEFLL